MSPRACLTTRFSVEEKGFQRTLLLNFVHITYISRNSHTRLPSSPGWMENLSETTKSRASNEPEGRFSHFQPVSFRLRKSSDGEFNAAPPRNKTSRRGVDRVGMIAKVAIQGPAVCQDAISITLIQDAYRQDELTHKSTSMSAETLAQPWQVLKQRHRIIIENWLDNDVL